MEIDMPSDNKRRTVVLIKGTGPKVRPPKLWGSHKPPGGKPPKKS